MLSGVAWWRELSDDELHVRLTGAGAQLAGWSVDALVNDRDDDDAAAVITDVLGVVP